VCSSILDAEEYYTEHSEIYFLSFTHTLDIFVLALTYKLSQIHDFMYKRFFIDCSQRQPTVPLSIRISVGSLYCIVSIINYKWDKDNVSQIY
jgi:hypothetical protein